MKRSGRILDFPTRRGVERHDEARPKAAHGSRVSPHRSAPDLALSERGWPRSRVGSLNAEARQPRVDGRAGELILFLDADFERGRFLRGAGWDGRGGASGSQGSCVRAL